MTSDDWFWQIIDSTVDKDMDAQLEKLETRLKTLSDAELLAFEIAFSRQSHMAYRWDLWGAAYVINGGCSDDGFADFRAWLIAQGRAVYDAALADPESLARHIEEDYASFEEFAYAAMEQQMERTGDEFPEGALPKHPSEPTGKAWDEDDLDDLFPKLTAKVESFG